ncbi:hypothetical protein B9G55_18115 [Saccharibacillus sp. O16]|nr:hypothetical protein B9G55_18115 [Saccharibacillus sp. O16]
MSKSPTIQNSAEREEIRAEYERLWIAMQAADTEMIRRMLERNRRELLPWRQRMTEMLRPLHTKMLWVIPLAAASVVGASYIAFIFVALWVE